MRSMQRFAFLLPFALGACAEQATEPAGHIEFTAGSATGALADGLEIKRFEVNVDAITLLAQRARENRRLDEAGAWRFDLTNPDNSVLPSAVLSSGASWKGLIIESPNQGGSASVTTQSAALLGLDQSLL